MFELTVPDLYTSNIPRVAHFSIDGHTSCPCVNIILTNMANYDNAKLADLTESDTR